MAGENSDPPQQNLSTEPTQDGNDAAEFIKSLPHWLRPGVSAGLHLFLRAILICLNVLLATCALLRVFSPHFEIMFLLSVGLTACYFYFMAELGRIHAQAQRSTAPRQVVASAEKAGGDSPPAQSSEDKKNE